MTKGAIDVLCYLFTPEAVQKMFLEPPEFQQIVKWWKMRKGTGGWSPDEFVEKMDSVGVDKIFIPAVKMGRYRTQEMIWDISNEEVYQVIKNYPDRLFGLAGIHPYRGKAGLQDLEEGVKEYGFKGAYLHTYGFGLPINDKLYYPYFAKCEELGIPLLMQVGHSAERMPSALGKPILMDEIALDFPELNLVGAHTGWPWVEEMIALAWKHPNVYVSLDAHMPKYLDSSLVKFMDTRGKHKVLYGTNGPLGPFAHETHLKQMYELGLKDETLEKVLRENAVNLFNLE